MTATRSSPDAYIVAGVRYITNSPSIKIVLTRTILTGAIGGSISGLMPLVAVRGLMALCLAHLVLAPLSGRSVLAR